MSPIIGGGIASLLTVLILSRVVAANPAYQFALHLLIGTGLGYIAAVLLRTAILPLLQGDIFRDPLRLGVLGVALVLVVMLVPRFGKQQLLPSVANYPLSIIFGVGAALALLGAIRGTLVPQILDTIRLRGLTSGDVAAQLGAATVAILTITTLLSFAYTTREGPPTRLGRLGRGLGRAIVLAAFGVFFAAAVRTYVAALVGQITVIIDWINLLIGTP